MKNYKDKVAIVTGGCSGLGKSLAYTLVKHGARVVIADINPGTYGECSFSNPQVYRVDVSQAEQVQELVDRVFKEYGRLDYIFNNAGISLAGELRDTSLEHWNRLIDVNLRGVVHGVQAAYPVMIRQGSGHIVNTASLLGLVPTPTLGAYSATKHAIVGLSGALRAEAAGFGIRVSAICPGFIQTNLLDSSLYANTRHQDMLAVLPFNPIHPDRAAEAVLRGVLKNKAIITVPGYADLIWYAQRLSPVFTNLAVGKMVKDLRRMRRD